VLTSELQQRFLIEIYMYSNILYIPYSSKNSFKTKVLQICLYLKRSEIGIKINESIVIFASIHVHLLRD